MIQIGSLIASTRVNIVSSVPGDLSACVMSPCVGDRIFDNVPPSVSLLGDDHSSGDQTFSVTSLVLTADLN